MKKVIVQKFGGTSVADTDKIKNVAQTVIREKNNGNDVVVVVSAMGHTTDHLVKMARDLISTILAFEWTFSVKIPICIALKLTALYP